MIELIIITFVVFIICKLYKSYSRHIDKIKRAEKDIILFSSAVEKNPKNPRFYFLRGTCYHDLNNYRLAIYDYTKAFELNKDNQSYNFLSGNAVFSNYLILKNRSSAKSEIGDKYGSKQDGELALKYK